MVPFSGYKMPVQYSKGIKYEHEFTRSQAGLFDISHMGQIKLTGDNALSVLETLVPSNIESLKINQQRYTVLTNGNGGIIDDLMVTRCQDHLFLVVNADCKAKDFQFIRSALPAQYRLEFMNEMALLALQGPKAASVIAEYITDIDNLRFLRGGNYEIEGIECFINRCGYTGEDGFEISVLSEDAIRLSRILLSHECVEPIGLGARDSLRLEAGLCLHGHDIDENTSPVEASLNWVIAKKYKGSDGVEARFPGAKKILNQLIQGTERIRVGIQPEGKMPIREGTEMFDSEGTKVGHISSGGFGPSTGRPVAMAYIKTAAIADDAEYNVVIRNKKHNIRIAKLPFIEHRYYK